MFEYFFSEIKLLNYVQNRKNVIFSPTIEDYIQLFKHLEHYIDEENIKKEKDDLDKEVESILQDEDNFYNSDEKAFVRNDKMGTIGEYMFSQLLSQYFGYSCIIPKINLSTNKNRNAYGIDTLYYSEDENMILFGESKLTKNLTNGIQQIKKSLQKYEQQISDEFQLVLSGSNYTLRKVFSDKFKEYIDKSIDMKSFIKVANFKKIGVPVFIAHGEEIDASAIIKRLDNIVQNKFFDLKTKYIFISLPIVNKYEFIAMFTKFIRERKDYYKNVVS